MSPRAYLRSLGEGWASQKKGKRFTLNVRNPAHFEVIAVNDLVELAYIEATAISVDSFRKQ